MGIVAGEDIKAEDYINESEADPTPANDAGRVPKLEADAKIARYFHHLNQKSVLVAGENITGATTPQACFIMSAQRLNKYKLVATNLQVGEATFSIYNDGANDRRAGYNFSSGSYDNIVGFAFRGSDVGTISGHNYILELFAVDGSGFPTGAAIGSKAFTNAMLSEASGENAHWYIEFDSPVAVSVSTSYIVTIRETTTTGSSGACLTMEVRTAGGGMKHATTGSNWANGYPGQSNGSVACCILYGYTTQTVGRVYLSDGNDADKNYFDGWVYETVTVGNNCNLLWGIDVPFFSGLLPGTNYYLDTTPGTITATKAKGKKVGTAKSTTSISMNEKIDISDFGYTESDLESVPSIADGLIETNTSSNTSIQYVISEKFHEVLFKKATKRVDISIGVTNQNLTSSFYIRQKDYLSINGNTPTDALIRTSLRVRFHL